MSGERDVSGERGWSVGFTALKFTTHLVNIYN